MTLREMSDEDLAALTIAVETFGETVASLKRRRIHFTVMLLVSVVLDIVLSLGLGLVALQATHSAHLARQASSTAALLAVSNRTRCQSGNEFRVADRARWDYLISLSPAPTTEAAQQRLKRFESYINAADALKNCDAKPAAGAK